MPYHVIVIQAGDDGKIVPKEAAIKHLVADRAKIRYMQALSGFGAQLVIAFIMTMAGMCASAIVFAVLIIGALFAFIRGAVAFLCRGDLLD